MRNASASLRPESVDTRYQRRKSAHPEGDSDRSATSSPVAPMSRARAAMLLTPLSWASSASQSIVINVLTFAESAIRQEELTASVKVLG